MRTISEVNAIVPARPTNRCGNGTVGVGTPKFFNTQSGQPESREHLVYMSCAYEHTALEFELTPAQARMLAAALVAQADIADKVSYVKVP